MKNRKRRAPFLWRGILFAAALSLVAIALSQALVDRFYTVRTPRMASDGPIRIVLLTDLHNYTFGQDQSPLVQRVARMKPDLIVLAGDIIDVYYPAQGTELLLSGLSAVAPMVYVTGNHEYWGGDIGEHKQLLRDHGVTVLENQTARVTLRGQAITLYGVDDPDYTRARDYARFFENMPPLPADTYNILLCHRPDPAELFASLGFDLVLSGHAHGGQVRLPPFVDGLYAPDQGWYPTYAGGVHRLGDTTLIISRGLALYQQLPRVFNPPEVVCIDIAPEKSKPL